MGRIVLFGATGYTGRLTAEALIERGLRPVLAARDETKLAALAESLPGEADLAIVDLAKEERLEGLLNEGDLLLTTVGPFVKWGSMAAKAAIAGGAHYMDSTGEPEFIRQMFGEWSDRGAAAGIAMLPAFGFDCVARNLAGAMALRAAGPAASGLDTACFISGGRGSEDFSSGTLASLAAGAGGQRGFSYHDGELRGVGGADRLGTFEVDGRNRLALLLGASEHFSLPRIHPSLRTVRCYLGLFGPVARSIGSGATNGLEGGPPPAQRAQVRVDVLARAYDASGRSLATIRLRGNDPYGLTAAILAWGSERAIDGRDLPRGALGPVEAFGLEQLEIACAEAGLSLGAEAS